MKARLRGPRVTGSCSADGRKEVLALGVSDVVDYQGFDFAGYRNRFDLFFDTAGKLSICQCGVMLKRGG
jgi:hypothetical protein